ncbi:hypothetical protein D3C86_1758100 [compost metagenome]
MTRRKVWSTVCGKPTTATCSIARWSSVWRLSWNCWVKTKRRRPCAIGLHVWRRCRSRVIVQRSTRCSPVVCSSGLRPVSPMPMRQSRSPGTWRPTTVVHSSGSSCWTWITTSTSCRSLSTACSKATARRSRSWSSPPVKHRRRPRRRTLCTLSVLPKAITSTS